MESILKTTSKYAIVLIAEALVGYILFYFKNVFFQVKTAEDMQSFWYLSPFYFGYVVQLLVAVLLLFDTQKLNKKYYLIPLAGLFYPLLGITILLIVTIYQEQRVNA